MSDIRNTTKRLRKEIFLTAYSRGVGHLASAYSAVEIIYTLYLGGVMKYNAANPDWEGRDYFILSKGHGSLALYSILCEAGFFPKTWMQNFCCPDGILGVEPHTLEIPGVEASTGSLGHGLSIGVGMALALKSDAKPNHVYVLVGDGECQEGSIWEAVMSAAAFNLDNLTMIIDYNHIQKMDFIKNIIGIDNLAEKLSVFGWNTKHVDGHDTEALKSAFSGVWGTGKPRCVMAETVKGKGLSVMENNPAWHWRMPNKKELKVFMNELDIKQEEIDICKKHI
jgi:transketolase